ncbi:hypothetical protein Tco_0562884 [Tanacetum coccineum]
MAWLVRGGGVAVDLEMMVVVDPSDEREEYAMMMMGVLRIFLPARVAAPDSGGGRRKPNGRKWEGWFGRVIG